MGDCIGTPVQTRQIDAVPRVRRADEDARRLRYRSRRGERSEKNEQGEAHWTDGGEREAYPSPAGRA